MASRSSTSARHPSRSTRSRRTKCWIATISWRAPPVPQPSSSPRSPRSALGGGAAGGAFRSAREHCGHGRFMSRESVPLTRVLRSAKSRGKISRRVCVEYPGVYVALSADRACVTEPRSNDVDRMHDSHLRDPLVPCGSEVGEGPRREHCASPRAEVLRREILVRNLSQVLVHVV